MNSTSTIPTASDKPEHHLSARVDVSFHQKSTILSLVIIGTIALYYFARVWEMVRAGALGEAGAALPPEFSGLVLTTVIGIIIVEAVLQAVLAFGAGAVPDVTPRDAAAAAKAQRNAYGVLVAGVLFAFSSLFWNPSPFVMGNLLLLGFVLAELARRGSQLFYYAQSSRRSHLEKGL